MNREILKRLRRRQRLWPPENGRQVSQSQLRSYFERRESDTNKELVAGWLLRFLVVGDPCWFSGNKKNQVVSFNQKYNCCAIL
jgi:hypothetical protein